jgi:hypothetical protein
MRMDIQISSPYHSSLALNRGGFPEGLSCHHFDPIRYLVRGASHPVISATAARHPRVLAETRQMRVDAAVKAPDFAGVGVPT